MIALFMCIAACGNADIVAPEVLSVVDTYPGNGSLVAALETTVALTFSADVQENTVLAALTLEETSAGGTPIRAIALSSTRYDAETFTAVLRCEPLPASSSFTLTLESDVLRAKSGARLPGDLRRAFRTFDQ